MVKVKFIKDHPVGIKKGKETEMPMSGAIRLQKEGYLEIIEEDIKKTKEDKIKHGKSNKSKKP